MPDSTELLLLRARKCPFACLLKILFLLLFTVALYIALYYQDMPPFIYTGFMVIIAFIAMLALAINRNCRLKLNEKKDVPVSNLSS